MCGLNPPSFPRGPAQIGFTPNGDGLVVAVKGTNTIYVFRLDEDGVAGDDPVITQASGPALPSYFGFTFDSGNGSLTVVTGAGGLPASRSAQGIAAY